MTFPFRQKEISRTSVLRTFSSDVDPGDLIWHRDRENRVITVVSGAGWEVQLEDKLPQPLSVNESVFIESGTWHRVIKGTSDLIVKIDFV